MEIQNIIVFKPITSNLSKKLLEMRSENQQHSKNCLKQRLYFKAKKKIGSLHGNLKS